MTKPTTLTTAEIDALTYTEARKAVKAVATGTWVSSANSSILKAFLKGEITSDEAKARTFGGTASPAPASPGSETALLAAALKAAVQPQLEELTSRIEATTTSFGEAIDELSVQIAMKSSAPSVEIPPTLTSDIEALKEGHRVLSDSIAKRNSKLAELTDMVKAAIEKGHTSITTIIAPTVGLKAAPAAGVDPTLEVFQRYCQPGFALKPVLVKGGQGSGKTFGAREWGKKFDEYIEFGFQPETTPGDMFGFPTATTDWVDGPLSRAWRLAASGKKVLLVLDEVYRATGAARQALLTPLSPREIDEKHYYALNTGRKVIDPVTGVECTEEILCPRGNLAIIGTTNVGAKFDVNAGDNAEKERFAAVHVEVEEAKLRAVLSAAATAKGFSPSVVDKIVAFWTECGILAADNFIEVRPTTRILSEAVLFAVDEADVPQSMRLLGMNIWVAETLEGLPEPEQVKKVEAAISKAFGIGASK